jgi:hypothetical protein
LPDFGRELVRNSLVGIHFENPVAAALADTAVPRIALVLPLTFDKQLRKATGDDLLSIAAIVEDDDDFVGETQPLQAGRQPPLLIVCNDERRQCALEIVSDRRIAARHLLWSADKGRMRQLHRREPPDPRPRAFSILALAATLGLWKCSSRVRWLPTAPDLEQMRAGCRSR